MDVERLKDYGVAFVYFNAATASLGIPLMLIAKNVNLIAKGAFSQMSNSTCVPLLIVNTIGMVTCFLLAKRLYSIFLGRFMATFDNGRQAPFPEWAQFNNIVFLRFNQYQ